MKSDRIVFSAIHRALGAMFCAVFLGALMITAAPVFAADKVTFEGLLDEMVDLGHLCEFPDPPFSEAQISSYDRMSERVEQANAWHANFDSGSALYVGTIKERTPYYVLSPMQGQAPDGYFEKGAKVGVSKKFQKLGNHVYAYSTAPDGTAKNGSIPQGYIDLEEIENDPKGVVLAEMQGAGAVVRIWCAKVRLTPQKSGLSDKMMSIDDLHTIGNLRVYIDGAPTPVIDCPMQTVMNGKWEIWDAEKKSKWKPISRPLVQETMGGYSLFFPISYSKSCKVTCQVVPEDFTYHVEYRKYRNGTTVEPLSIELLQKARKKIQSVTANLTKQPAVGGTGQSSMSQAIAPDKSASLAISGSGSAVVSLEAIVDAIDERVLRTILLRGIFDGADSPQIECPLGDFFGSAPGINEVETLPLRMKNVSGKGVMQCLWIMPFRKSARFEIHNLGDKAVTVSLKAKTAPYKVTTRTMQFHAKWNDGEFPVRPFKDWNFCTVDGQGVLVADVLTVNNPVSDWWGNGDERIFVDKEPFPSHFGTGTQDYFGFCALSRRLLKHPYHTRSRADGPANLGFISLNRIRMLDAIPFRTELKFNWEVWHVQPMSGDINYAGVAYFYATPEAKDGGKPIDKERLAHFPKPARTLFSDDVKRMEAEKLVVSRTSEGAAADEQIMNVFPDGTWSMNSQLFVRGNKPGSWVDIVFPCDEAATYDLFTNFTKASDYGIGKFFVNGKLIGGPTDFFVLGHVVSTGDTKMGRASLHKGTNTLRVEIVDTNQFSSGAKYLIGLDYIRLVKVAK